MKAVSIIFLILTTTFTVVNSADASTWPACPTDGETCGSGFYKNKLACACFAIVQCSTTCEAGNALIPTEACRCAPFSDFRSLFPSWSTREDVELSFQLGIDEVAPEAPSWQVCPNTSNTSRCTSGLYFNELVCQCLECSSCDDLNVINTELRYPDFATDEDKRIAKESGCQSCN